MSFSITNYRYSAARNTGPISCDRKFNNQKLVIGKIYVFRQLDNFTIENRDTAHYTYYSIQS